MRPGRVRPAWPSRWARHSAVRLAAAVTLAAAAGFAAAAYTEALPAPAPARGVQRAGVRGRAGYQPPGAGRGRPAPVRGTTGRTGARRTRRARPQPSAAPSARPGASASAAPPAAGQAVLSVTAASGRIVAGGGDTFTGSLTDHGQPVAGVNLSLLERAAGQPSWHLIGFATTGANGRAVGDRLGPDPQRPVPAHRAGSRAEPAGAGDRGAAGVGQRHAGPGRAGGRAHRQQPARFPRQRRRAAGLVRDALAQCAGGQPERLRPGLVRGARSGPAVAVPDGAAGHRRARPVGEQHGHGPGRASRGWPCR